MNIVYSKPTSAVGSKILQLLKESELIFVTQFKDPESKPIVSCSCCTYSWKGLSDILDFIRTHKDKNKQD